MQTVILVTLGVIALLLMAGCVYEVPNEAAEETSSTQELKKFSSKDELKSYLENTQPYAAPSYNVFGDVRLFETTESQIALEREMAAVSNSATPTTKSESAPARIEGAEDFSQTNIQVKGVDEADIVKNDEKHIYALTQNTLVIVDAFPAENADIVSKIEVAGKARDLFVNDDQLIIFSEVENETIVFPLYDAYPRTRYAINTLISVYDVSDRANPRLANEFSLTGGYFESRMIENIIYVVAKEFVWYYDDYFVDVPVVRGQDAIIVKPDIYYFDNPERNYVFHTIAAIDLNKPENLNAQTFMLGRSNSLYVSREAMYIAYNKNQPPSYYEEQQKQQFFDVVVPLLPSKTRQAIDLITKNATLSDDDLWDKIAEELETTYNSMTENERKQLWEEIDNSLTEHIIKQQQELTKTVIHKIALQDGTLGYQSMGEVPGTILNQFSMDEYDGMFRIATTLNVWARGSSIIHNNVYVLDEDMQVVGELEGIAPDESIFSTRFIGERLYMVTFERIDPFFVIDLSTNKPKILGELKIPGFSNYLHLYDENHIIGLGKETKENKWGGVSVQGVKLALFDVTNVSKPKQIAKLEIGEAGSDSEALRDHKAFLFDKEKNLLVLPIREIKSREVYDTRYRYYRQRIWHGAYVLGITPEDGFEIKGKISHSDAEERINRYYYSSPSAVRRSLYMDDVLYTVSQTAIKANSLENIEEELAEIKLPYRANPYIWDR